MCVRDGVGGGDGDDGVTLVRTCDYVATGHLEFQAVRTLPPLVSGSLGTPGGCPKHTHSSAHTHTRGGNREQARGGHSKL